MSNSSRPLIVGAGPTGKGAALFLARAGIETRIIDSAIDPSPFSKALAVNPRTLEILEPTGITEQMLSIGVRIRGARVQLNGRPTAEISFASSTNRFPFMLAVSQIVTERLLAESLTTLGINVERGIKLVGCTNSGKQVEARLEHISAQHHETVACPWLFAADGAHSSTRQALGVNFAGSSFDSPWHLIDVPLKTTLPEEYAHVSLFDAGFVFAIRVVDDSPKSPDGSPLWRIISNLPVQVSRLDPEAREGTPVWKSSFRIAHRIAEHFRIGNVYFAGDAAHIHSPIGARGMNLGLEDAWVFSELMRQGRSEDYNALRKPFDAGVVRRVEFFSRMVLGDSIVLRLLRSIMIRWGTKLPIIRRQILKTIAGLER